MSLSIRLFHAVLTGLMAAGALAAQNEVSTMRVDLVHTGTASEETFKLDGSYREGPWPGPPGKTEDLLNLGKYFYEVRDNATGRLLYSRGYASIFGEWELTDEARQRRQSFSESVRFPFPASSVKLTLKKRDKRNVFREIWSDVVEPAKSSTKPDGNHRIWEVVKNGEPASRVDLLLLGDGYTRDELGKWHEDARRIAGYLFSVSPFREQKDKFNVWAIDTPAIASGVSRPSDNITQTTPLGATYDAFGSERYVLTFENKRLRQVAAQAPYEFLLIAVNERKYGGGGIFNLYSTAAAHNDFAPYLVVHEFAHHFSALADEYYTSDVAYTSDEQAPEPWEPNVTADKKAKKWSDLLTSAVALPTPWPKSAFEALENKIQSERRRLRTDKRPEREMEDLFRREGKLVTELLAPVAAKGSVGAFEGANYLPKDSYRSQVDCLMFSRNDVGFCAVCRRAIERVIALYVAGK